MNDISAAVPLRRLCMESAKKAAVCLGAAVAIGAALPYSMNFAFQAVTYLAFVVALTEGAVSLLADLLDQPDFAVRKTLEGVETLGASVALAVASLYVQLV